MSVRGKPKAFKSDSYEKPQQGKNTFMLFLRTAMATDESPLDMNSDARVLFDAIRKGKSHMIRFILDAAPGDLANSLDIKGKTPLMVCCQIKEESRRTLAVRLLLANGADVNIQDDDGRTVLMHACTLRCNDIVETLVKQVNIDPEIPDNKGNTALMHCSMVGNDVATDILLRHFRRLGLNVDHQNEDGFNALLLAAKYGNIACAKLLVEGHASLNQRDKISGLNAQEWLKKNGYSVEDVTPLAMRLRSRSRLLKALNIARFTVPSRFKEELGLDEDEEDENANTTKYRSAFQTATTPIMTKHGSFDRDRRRASTYLPRQFRLSENLCNEAVTPIVNPDCGCDMTDDPLELLEDLSSLNIHGNSARKPRSLDFKIRCPDRRNIFGDAGGIGTSAELPRWKPHFNLDNYSMDSQEELEDVLFGKSETGNVGF